MHWQQIALTLSNVSDVEPTFNIYLYTFTKKLNNMHCCTGVLTPCCSSENSIFTFTKIAPPTFAITAAAVHKFYKYGPPGHIFFAQKKEQPLSGPLSAYFHNHRSTIIHDFAKFCYLCFPLFSILFFFSLSEEDIFYVIFFYYLFRFFFTSGI